MLLCVPAHLGYKSLINEYLSTFSLILREKFKFSKQISNLFLKLVSKDSDMYNKADQLDCTTTVSMDLESKRHFIILNGI